MKDRSLSRSQPVPPSLPSAGGAAAALVAPVSGDAHNHNSEKPNAISHFNVNLERINPPIPMPGAARPPVWQVRDNEPDIKPLFPGGYPVTDGRMWLPEDKDHPTGPFVVHARCEHAMLPGTCSVPGCAHHRPIGKLARDGVEATRVIYGENLPDRPT